MDHKFAFFKPFTSNLYQILLSKALYKGFNNAIKLINVKGCDSNFEVNIFQILKAATNEKVFKHYPCTYCLLQGICFICSNLKIRITS